MVVVHPQPSTSTPTVQKKNRRKLHKKRTAGGEDAEMHEEHAAASLAGQAAAENDEDDVMIDTNDVGAPNNSAPAFTPLPASAQRTTLKSETRRIPIPPHRMTPLKKEWVNIFGPLTEILGLQVRMNVQRRSVEIRVRFQEVGV